MIQIGLARSAKCLAKTAWAGGCLTVLVNRCGNAATDRLFGVSVVKPYSV
jgi:hypothetical protein